MENELNDKLYELHKNIMNLVINFCKENNIRPEYGYFGVDDLGSSIDAGQWHPGTDSSLTFFDENKEPLICSI